MPAHIKSAALQGIDAIQIDVEVDVLAGLPSFTVVGLGDTAIKESKERLIAALSNIGYKPPRRKTIVSLAPASVRKEGSTYDIPITLGFLLASKQVELPKERLNNAWFTGELGLDGTIRPVRGVLPMLLAAIKKGIKEIYVPAGNAQEAAAVADQLTIYAVESLSDLIQHLAATHPARQLKALERSATPNTALEAEIDFADIKGQEHAKRALAICAAGSHNALLVGPPGTGKTLLARALAGILPPLTSEESQIITSLYSIAGLLDHSVGLVTQRPFRSPHHGASSVALIGGGSHPKPGEVSLAHHGVLFLDELPEFSRHTLEQLRQPLEDGIVTVSRAAHTLQFPARSMVVVGAMNPCPCGFIGSERKDCTCTPADVLRYQRKVSGPLLDRFDLQVVVADVSAEELLDKENRGATNSHQYREQVAAARAHQQERQGQPNAALKPQELQQFAPLSDLSQQLVIKAQHKFQLSSRGVHRLLKVSRTIADLAGDKDIEPKHLAEALQYREQLKSVLPDFA